MSDEKYNQNLMVGAAVLAGILGTLSALNRSNRTVKGWTEQAKGVANQVLEKGEAVNKNMLLGGVAGGLIGATAALLLAPKAGSELMKDLAHPFSHEEHARSTSRRSASRKSTSRRKGIARSAKKSASHHEEGKSHKPAAKKKSPARRRTATAAHKQVAATEKTEAEASAAS